MTQRLKYDIDKVAIENNVYHPKGFVEIETEQHALRKAALAVFSGEQPIQATVVGRVQTTQPLQLPEEVGQPAIAQPEQRRPALLLLRAEVLPRQPGDQ
jgi:hypothetical protein